MIELSDSLKEMEAIKTRKDRDISLDDASHIQILDDSLPGGLFKSTDV